MSVRNRCHIYCGIEASTSLGSLAHDDTGKLSTSDEQISNQISHAKSETFRHQISNLNCQITKLWCPVPAGNWWPLHCAKVEVWSECIHLVAQHTVDVLSVSHQSRKQQWLDAPKCKQHQTEHSNTTDNECDYRESWRGWWGFDGTGCQMVLIYWT